MKIKALVLAALAALAIGAAATQPANLIVNGDMEAGDPPVGWNHDKTLTLSASKDTPDKSGQCLLASVDPIQKSANFGVARAFSVSAPGTYTVEFDYLMPAGSIYFGVYSDQEGNRLADTPPASGTWKRYSHTLTFTADTKSGYIAFYPINGSQLYLDNVSIVFTPETEE